MYWVDSSVLIAANNSVSFAGTLKPFFQALIKLSGMAAPDAVAGTESCLFFKSSILKSFVIPLAMSSGGMGGFPFSERISPYLLT